jgi:hypothetical protein
MRFASQEQRADDRADEDGQRARALEEVRERILAEPQMIVVVQRRAQTGCQPLRHDREQPWMKNVRLNASV